MYTKESLESLRQRINLFEVASSHIELKATGSTYKALCPFHDEKTPSFVISRGDSHYHCFGCGAHGDAIQFLMNHLQINFREAVESLASQFQVQLVKLSGEEEKGPDKKRLKEALNTACHFYHFMLLHTQEGREALKYLFGRGIDLNFIRRFRLGLAPREPGIFRKILLAQSISQEILVQAGLLVQKDSGKIYDFFYDRITFPICDGTGAVIGFSARKYREETFGGKYVNTSETPLFKKSRVLFGWNYSRKRIVKERRALLVEGQLDALRLIEAGFDLTVAAQGTAFGEGHVKELIDAGVEKIFIAFDADKAGQQAAVKVGGLFQKGGIGVYVVSMPKGEDPDSFLRSYGSASFLTLLSDSQEYLPFLIDFYAKEYDFNTPAGKNGLVDTVARQIRLWDNPIMVHESLRKLAQLTHIPEEVIGVGASFSSPIYFKRSANIGLIEIDPDHILEMELLRWLILKGETHPHLIDIASLNLSGKEFQHSFHAEVYTLYLERARNALPRDFLSLGALLNHENFQSFIDEIMGKKINDDKIESLFCETLQKILDRRWMEQCEEIRMKIASGNCSDEEILKFVITFDNLKRNRPQVKSFQKDLC